MDNNQKFEDLINKDKYQVFVFCCPAYFPLNFARHPWVVINKKGDISRYEITHFKDNGTYLHVNMYPAFQGIKFSFFTNKHNKEVQLLGFIEGDENSTAFKVIEFIEDSTNTYSYCNKYGMLGPNSNTYLQNVLNKFHEFHMKLPWNFIGKGFK